MFHSIRSPGPVSPQDVHCEGFDMTYTRIANDISSSTSTMPTNNNNDHQHHHFLDKKVDESIENFLQSLTQIGPELLSGMLTLKFFERHHYTSSTSSSTSTSNHNTHKNNSSSNSNNRNKSLFFGLLSGVGGVVGVGSPSQPQQEKVVWESWIVKVVVNNTPRPLGDDKASIMERKRIKDTAEVMLKSVFMKIYEYASGGGNNNHREGAGAIVGGGLDHIPPSMYEFEIRCNKRTDSNRENVYSRVVNMPALLNLDGS